MPASQREMELEDKLFDLMRVHERRELNARPRQREELEQAYPQVWDTTQLAADFNVTGFCAPYVVVCRKSDGVTGSLKFQHSPRFYFEFEISTDD